MLYNDDPYIRAHRMEGMTGLELESHRIDPQGLLAQTPHPFQDNPYIDRDFSEAQMEINTPPAGSPAEALAFLTDQLTQAQSILSKQGELLWPFSNPPVIRNEDDIPIARYVGEQAPSYFYRVYLAERYGKYKMTYSGIHYNYSFSEDLLRHNYELEGVRGSRRDSWEAYRDLFYLKLAEKVLAHSWAVVALLAASPLVDNSFYEAEKTGDSIFTGFATLRNSEFGYWNPFLPILSYDSVAAYADSIEQFLEMGLLIQARELYYPVRIKPPGRYTLKALREDGISHIELRMVDLNPFADSGIDLRDAEFLKLLLVWLASTPMKSLDQQEQMQALQNHKTAASYDWNLARITMPGRRTASLRCYLSELLGEMAGFYADDPGAQDVIAYQMKKLEDETCRYAPRVRAQFGEDYIGTGIDRARELQEALHV